MHTHTRSQPPSTAALGVVAFRWDTDGPSAPDLSCRAALWWGSVTVLLVVTPAVNSLNLDLLAHKAQTSGIGFP